jgi:hypothetical protein
VILPIVVVALDGTNPDIASDVAMANVIWNADCGVFVDVVQTLVVSAPNLLFLTQEDCSGVGHQVSDEEDELYSIGRGLGTDLVAYYIQGSAFGSSVLGCAAHPPDRRGFWVVSSGFTFVFAHEAVHVVGDNPHNLVDTDNLMWPFADEVTNLPPDLNEEQCQRILNDPALLSIESIVLNL